MAYTLHMELTDGTLDTAFHSLPTKALAIRIAKMIAKQPSFDAVRLIVNDKDDMTVLALTLPEWTP